MIETVGAMRLSSLTTGTICRIGIALSTCFWIPAALLMGIAGAMGLLPDPDLGFVPRGFPGFAGGFLQGIGCSIVNDLVVVLGAVGFALLRGTLGAPDPVLKQRRR